LQLISGFKQIEKEQHTQVEIAQLAIQIKGTFSQ